MKPGTGTQHVYSRTETECRNKTMMPISEPKKGRILEWEHETDNAATALVILGRSWS